MAVFRPAEWTNPVGSKGWILTLKHLPVLWALEKFSLWSSSEELSFSWVTAGF